MTFTFKSESDARSTVHHLRVAAERYDENAAELAKIEGAGYSRLREQFERQATEARRIADEIESQVG